MKKKILVILISLVVLGLLESGLSIQIDDPIRNSTVENTTIIEYFYEYIMIDRIDNQTFIGSSPKITSEEDLISYQQKLVERLNYFINSSYSRQSIFTTLTFSNPLTEEEVVGIAQSSGFEILSLRYISTDGGGEIPYPIDHERLAEMELRIAEFERAYNNITNFVLIKGFVSARVLISNISAALQSNGNFFAIDVGPVEFLQLYPDAIIIPGRSLFYRYNKTIASSDIEAPTIHNAEVFPQILNSLALLTIKANVSDNIVVDDVHAIINGTSLALTDINGDGIFENTSILPPNTEGSYIINITAIDLAGNSIYNDSFEIIIDNTLPSIEFQGPANGSFIASSNVSVEWNATDNIGIKHYKVVLDTVLIEVTAQTSRLFSALREGLHTVIVKVFDSAGNMASKAMKFTVDTTPPSISEFSVAPSAGFTCTIYNFSAKVTDETSGVKEVIAKLISSNGSMVLNLSKVNSTYFGSISNLQTNSYFIEILAEDNAGNIAIERTPFNVTSYVLEWLPPINLSKSFNLGSTIPIKFTLHDKLNGSFVFDNSVRVEVFNPNNVLVFNATYGTGDNFVRINATEEHYITNLHTNKTWFSGNYTIKISSAKNQCNVFEKIISLESKGEGKK